MSIKQATLSFNNCLRIASNPHSLAGAKKNRLISIVKKCMRIRLLICASHATESHSSIPPQAWLREKKGTQKLNRQSVS